MPLVHRSCGGWAHRVVFLGPLEGSNAVLHHIGTAGFCRWFLSSLPHCEPVAGIWVDCWLVYVPAVCASFGGIAKALCKWLCSQVSGTSCIRAHHFLMTTSNLSWSCLLAWPLGWHLDAFFSLPVEFTFFHGRLLFFFIVYIYKFSFTVRDAGLLWNVLLSLCSRLTFILHFLCCVYKQKERRE